MCHKHNCNGGNGPVFGRKTAGCPRCDELLAGAAPVRWSTANRNRAASVPPPTGGGRYRTAADFAEAVATAVRGGRLTVMEASAQLGNGYRLEVKPGCVSVWSFAGAFYVAHVSR